MVSTLTTRELTKFTPIVTGCRYYGSDGKRGSSMPRPCLCALLGIEMSVGPRVWKLAASHNLLLWNRIDLLDNSNAGEAQIDDALAESGSL